MVRIGHCGSLWKGREEEIVSRLSKGVEEEKFGRPG